MRKAAEKLIEAATRLFYQHGIAASGVDRVATEAGVTKPTLYAHFNDKTGLLVAVLENQHQQRRNSLESHLFDRSGLTALERLLSVFDWVEAQQWGDWSRGCPFVNASVELGELQKSAARDVVQRHKAWFRGVLTDLCRQAGAAPPTRVASELHLLIEGANARMLAESDLQAITDARAAAKTILNAALSSTGT